MGSGFELKSYLLSDFKNNKYKSISLIDLYASDYKYYSVLERKHLIADEAIHFFRAKDGAIKSAANIPTYAFRKLQYELIIADYLNSQINADTMLQNPPAPASEYVTKTQMSQNVPDRKDDEELAKKKTAKAELPFSKPTRKEKVLHCINDLSVLRRIGVRKVKLIKTGKTISLPMYECPSCKDKYTSLQEYRDRRLIILDGVKYTNINKEKDNERYIKYLQMPHAAIPGSECYVYGVNKPKVCRICGDKDLLSASIIIVTKKKKKKIPTYQARFCKACKTYYVPYNVFVSHESDWSLLNETEIPEIQKELRIIAEEKARKKAELKAAREARALKQKEEQLKRQQEELERQKEKLERERTAKEERDSRLREQLIRQEQRRKSQMAPSHENNQLHEHDNNIRIKDFVVRRTTFKCRHNGHVLQNIDAVINIIDRDGNVKQATVPAGYCPNCNVFFIMESTYQNLKARGTPVCRVTDEKAYLSDNLFVNGMQLAQESVLMQYGYSVSQAESLTTARRRKILALMIDNEVLTRSDIISYLDFFISQRKNQFRFEKAIEKWESDREFVSEYKSGSYSQYGIGGIYRKY